MTALEETIPRRTRAKLGVDEPSQESDLIYEALLYAPCGAVVASTSASGEILFINHDFTAITGYTHVDVPTVAAWIERAYPDPEYRAMIMANWERDVSEPHRRVVYTVTCKDGTRKEVVLRAALLPDERMVVTMVDASDRQRWERELQESEERFRKLAETVDHVFWIVQPEPEAILYASPAFETIWGRPVEDLYADTAVWSQCILLEDQESVGKAWTACVRGDLPTVQFEYRIRRPDGTIRWIEDSGAAVINSDGRVVRINGVAKDITARKSSERDKRLLNERVQSAQKLESLAVLAGGVAHDFNNLLVGILGHADLALMDLPLGSPARSNLEAIEIAAQRAADLARQMLAYSGRGQFIVDQLDLRNLVEEISHLLETTVSKKVKIKYTFDHRTPAVEGDSTQIRQVLMNLLTNASEAIDDRPGVISIATGFVDCDAQYLNQSGLDHEPAPGRYAFVEVSDTGCGMDEETRRKIFDPFFSTKFTGRGLGLAAVLGIVKGHNGAVQVDSERDKGTSFRVLLPAAEDMVSPKPPTVSTPGSGKHSGTVLVVDDEEAVRVVSTHMLRRVGYEVLTAEDGQQAIKVFADKPGQIDCVLLDLAMPNLDGQETLRELRLIQPDVKVLLSSGYNEQDAINRYAGMHLADFIQKPYSSTDLVDAVDKVLSR